MHDKHPDNSMTQSNQSRLYLDLDGVIYPIQHLKDANVDLSQVDKFHDREWWRTDVTRRVGQLGVEVVLASSWGESFMGPGRTVASPMSALEPDRALPIASQSLAKHEAVAADLADNPADFIWIDDDLTTDMIDYVRQHKPAGTKGLFVKPYYEQGLTMQELAAIETGFLSQVSELR